MSLGISTKKNFLAVAAAEHADKTKEAVPPAMHSSPAASTNNATPRKRSTLTAAKTNDEAHQSHKSKIKTRAEKGDFWERKRSSTLASHQQQAQAPQKAQLQQVEQGDTENAPVAPKQTAPVVVTRKSQLQLRHEQRKLSRKMSQQAAAGIPPATGLPPASDSTTGTDNNKRTAMRHFRSASTADGIPPPPPPPLPASDLAGASHVGSKFDVMAPPPPPPPPADGSDGDDSVLTPGCC